MARLANKLNFTTGDFALSSNATGYRDTAAEDLLGVQTGLLSGAEAQAQAESNDEAETEAEMKAEAKAAGMVTALVFGSLLLIISIPMQWFNEQRSVMMDTLVSRGLEECVSASSTSVSKANHGRLVHVQGQLRGMTPVQDARFKDAIVKNCIKLQSTVEVFEWVQTTRTWRDGNQRRTQPRFQAEWVTFHQDSSRFRKPSPDNPRPPSGIALGTNTQTCKRAELGAYVLSEDMVGQFHRFEPAINRLPNTVTSNGIVFCAHPEDGYYYTRPGLSAASAGKVNLFKDHQVGDMRVHFMCVPECEATVVAVQCQKGGATTFIPYRPIPRFPCLSENQERLKLIEEGDRPLKDVRSEALCCCASSAGVSWSSCLCCACKLISCLCKSEVVTEEIYYITDKLVNSEMPFEWIVPRSSWRVSCFRLLSWATMFFGVRVILGPFAGHLRAVPGLQVYGAGAVWVFAAMLALSLSSIIMAAVYLVYRPAMSVKWLAAATLIMTIPFVWGRLSGDAHAVAI